MSHLYSTIQISETLIKDLKESLSQIKNYGSMEVYVQDGIVTQISVRTIKKPKTSTSSR